MFQQGGSFRTLPTSLKVCDTEYLKEKNHCNISTVTLDKTFIWTTDFLSLFTYLKNIIVSYTMKYKPLSMT
jgi:hypothetical protein